MSAHFKRAAEPLLSQGLLDRGLLSDARTCWVLSQEAAVAGGSRETNSELSRVLDILDEAAGDTPAAVAHADTQGDRQ